MAGHIKGGKFVAVAFNRVQGVATAHVERGQCVVVAVEFGHRAVPLTI